MFRRAQPIKYPKRTAAWHDPQPCSHPAHLQYTTEYWCKDLIQWIQTVHCAQCGKVFDE